jgi:hypothetical protein
VVRAAHVRGVGGVGRRRRALDEVRLHRARGIPQRPLGAPGDGEDVPCTAGPGARLRERRLLEDDVRVGAADPEGADAGDARRAAARPRQGAGGEDEAASLEGESRVRAIEVEVRGDALVPQGQDRLDEPRDAGGRFQVADVGLQRAEHAARCSLAQHRRQRLELDGIAERRPRAVGLHVRHVAGSDAGALERLPEHGLLRQHVGRRQARRAPVLVHRGAPDLREHGVAGRAGGGEALEDHHAAALAAHVAVGARVEGLALAVRRERLGAREEARQPGEQHQVDAGGDGHRALVGPEALASQVHGHERRGAGGVHRQARSLQAQRVGEPARGKAVAVAGGRVDVEVLRIGHEAELLVVVRVDAHEHAGLAARERLGDDAGALQRLPGGLEQDALLGIHGRRLAGREAEEIGVESVDGLREEPAPARGAVLGARTAPPERIRAPAARGHLADRVDALLEQTPGALGIGAATGEAAGEAHDGDGLVARRGYGLHDGGLDRRRCHLLEDVLRQRREVRVREEEGRREAGPGDGLQAVPELEAHEGVEPQPGEGLGAIELRGRDAEHPPDLRRQQALDLGPPVRGASAGEPILQRPSPALRALLAAQVRPEAGAGQGRIELEPLARIEAQRRGLDDARAEEAIECVVGLVGRHAGDAARRQPLAAVRAGGRGARLGERSPVDAEGREASRPAVVGEGVQEGVGGGVVRLAG